MKYVDSVKFHFLKKKKNGISAVAEIESHEFSQTKCVSDFVKMRI